jgi:hypothetical protein
MTRRFFAKWMVNAASANPLGCLMLRRDNKIQKVFTFDGAP